MIKAVIFDMDGLIVDTEILESQALEKYLQSQGKKPQKNANGLIHEIGVAGDGFYKNFIKKYRLIEDYQEKYTKMYNFSYADTVVNSLQSVTMELINSY